MLLQPNPPPPPGLSADASPPCRRCGYSKAKQDPEEEKMHFHNGQRESRAPRAGPRARR